MLNVPGEQDDLTPFQKRLRGAQAEPRLAQAPVQDTLRLASPSASKPDESARILRAAARLGKDRDLVAANLDEAEKIVQEKDFNPENLAKYRPVFARWLSQSPHYMAVVKPDLAKLQDLETVFYRRDDPLRPMTEEEKEAIINRGADRAGKAAFSEAQLQGLKMFKDEASAVEFSKKMARERVEEVERYVTAKGPAGAFEAPGSIVRNVPIAGSAAELMSAADLYSSIKAIENGTATERDEDEVFLFGRTYAAAEARGQSFGGRVLEGVAAIPGFAAEFGLTGGAYRSGKAGAAYALRKALGKVLKRRAVNIVARTVGVIAGGVAQTAAQTAFMSFPADAIRRMTPGVSITPDEEGKLRAAIEEPGDDAATAIAKAFGSSFVENLSERSGVAVSKILGAAGKATGLSAVKAAVASRWLRLRPGRKVSDLLSEVGKKTGWNGVISEVMEERVGEVGRAALGIEQYKPPTMEDIAAEALTFMVPGTGAAGIRAIASIQRARENRAFFSSIQKVVREAGASNLSPETVEDLVGRLSENGGAEFAYVPIESWMAEWEKVKGDDGNTRNAKAEALALGVSESAYNRALQAGGDLQIPMPGFVMRLLREKHGDAFVPLARIDPEEATLPEAEREEAEESSRKPQPSELEIPQAPEILSNSPEGLVGEEFSNLVDTQAEEARKYVDSLPDGNYVLTYSDGTTRPVEIQRDKKGRALITGEAGGVDLARELLPQREEGGGYSKPPTLSLVRRGKKRVAPVDVGLPHATQEEAELVAAREALADRALDEAGAEEALRTLFPEKNTAAVDRAREATRQELVGQYSDSIRRRRLAEYKEERARVLAEVEAEVNDRKEYVALSVLRKGTLPSGAPAAIEGLKISREALNLDFPALSESSIPRGVLAEKGSGAHPDEIAEILGYSSGSEMLMALIDAEYRFPRETLIEDLTNARMAERSEAIEADPAKTHEEALKALHNTERSKLLISDLKHLISDEFASFKKLIRRVAGQVPRLEDITKWAEEEVRKESFRTLHPGIYRREAKKSSRGALNAFLKGDFQTAFQEKLQELQNNELAIAAQRLQDEARKIPKYMRRFKKTSVREALGRAGAEKYLDPIDDILETYDFSPASQRTVEKRASLQEWYDNEVKEGRTPQVPEKLLRQASMRNWRDLPLEDLLAIRDAVENISHLAKLKNKLLTDRERRAFDETVSGLKASIESKRTGKPKVDPIGDLTPMERLYRKIATGAASLRKASNIALELDGWKQGGPFWETFILPLNRAQEAERDLQEKADKRLLEIMSTYTRAERRRMYKREYTPEVKTSLSMWDRFCVALNMGNKENREAVSLGYDWTPEQLAAVVAPLTARDWKNVQAIWDHLETYWPDVKALSERVDGLAPGKVDRSPLTVSTSDGKTVNLEGGYYPLMYKPDPSRPHQTIEEIVDQSMRGGTWRASTKHAHRENRVGSGGRKVRLDLGVLTEHTRDVIHDLTHYEWLLDANKLLRERGLAGTIRETVGREAYDELLATVNAVALNNRQAVSSFDKIAEWLARKTRAAILVGNVVTIAKQYLGLAASTQNIGLGWTLRGLWSSGFGFSHTRQMEEFISERSTFMKNRRGTQDRDIADGLRRSIATGGEPGMLGQALEKWERFGYGLIGATQWHVDRATWLGAYQKYAEELGLEKAEDAGQRDKLEQRIAAMADQAVRDSQGSGLLADLPGAMRARGALRLMTLFQTFAVNQLNLFAAKALPAASRPSAATISAAAGAFVALYIIPAVMWDLVIGAARGGPGDEDDEDGGPGSFAKEVAATGVKEFLSSIPIVREAAPIVDLVSGEGSRDYRGPAGLALVAESMRLATQIGQYLEEGEDQLDLPLLRAAIRTSGIAVPGTSQIDRLINGYLLWVEEESNIPSIVLGQPPRQ